MRAALSSNIRYVCAGKQHFPFHGILLSGFTADVVGGVLSVTNTHV